MMAMMTMMGNLPAEVWSPEESMRQLVRKKVSGMCIFARNSAVQNQQSR